MNRSLKKVLRILGIILLFLGIIWLSLFTPVDRSPYQESEFYQQMDARLDSLGSVFIGNGSTDSLFIGWSRVSITPSHLMPLAGYSNRNPKLMEGIHDSIFVRAVVFKKGDNKAAIVSADLLIIHPEVTRKIMASLPSNWEIDQLFLTATHSHSSMGGWAPGLVGEAIAGFEDDTVAQFIADRVIQSLKISESNLEYGKVGMVESNLEPMVYNRLVQEKGKVDPWLKSILIDKDDELGILNFFLPMLHVLIVNGMSCQVIFPVG
ncbi:MAG: neutral/alkaline non-lysosomal ceramidase N-terminal domain-containing protein [Bacteroidota bacterium]